MIFETSHNIGLFPWDWKFANTVPIYKEGNKAEVNKYRPVSKINVVCTVMESIIRELDFSRICKNGRISAV